MLFNTISDFNGFIDFVNATDNEFAFCAMDRFTRNTWKYQEYLMEQERLKTQEMQETVSIQEMEQQNQ